MPLVIRTLHRAGKAELLNEEWLVVVTGSELVRGDRRDLNGPFLAGELLRRGIEPARIVIVGDREDELAAALAEGMDATLLVVSGGLGPTHDDRTVELVARAAGVGLRLDEDLNREIEGISRRFADRLGRPYVDFEQGVRKSLSIVATPLSTAQAMRDIRKEKVEYVTDAAQKAKIGQIADLSDAQEYHDVIDRERRHLGRHLFPA